MRAETLTHQDAFIGAVMMLGVLGPDNKKAARAAVLKLSPAMFEEGMRRAVFAAMQRMAYAGEDVGDPVLIVSRAAQESNLNVEDVKVYVTRAAETCPAVSNLDNYAALVVEDYRLDLLQSALLAACSNNSSADRICAKVRAALNMQDAILATQADGSGQTFAAVLDKAVAALEKPDTLLRTGWRQVDRYGLFEPTNTVVVAGRPGCGKTDLTINLAARLSLRKKVYYLTLEESAVKLMHRIISKTARVDAGRMRDRNLSRQELNNIRAVQAMMANHHNMILEDVEDVGGAATLDMIRARLLTYKPDVAIIDHIGLIAGTDPRAKEYDRLSEITRQLKLLAMQMGIVIIELCQLNRGGAAAQYGTLAELRGSGTIEQDANAVVMVRALPPGGAELHDTNDYRATGIMIAKNREGGLGEVPMQWRPQYHDWIPDGDIYQQDEGGENCPKFESYEQQQL